MKKIHEKVRQIRKHSVNSMRECCVASLNLMDKDESYGFTHCNGKVGNGLGYACMSKNCWDRSFEFFLISKIKWKCTHS